MTYHLEPVDTKRCQGEVVIKTPWSLGGTHRRERCANSPTLVATEKLPGEDGLIGSMSLCDHCKNELIKQVGPDAIRFDPIHTGD